MNIWYPFTPQSGHQPVKIVRAEKEFLYDETGKEYIDAVSSWWTCIYGHRHPVIQNAIRNQMDEMDHVMLAGITHEPAEKLAEMLGNFTNHDFSRVFYSDNGSTAVEVGIKIALQYFYNRNEPEKKGIIHFSDAYHGDTIGAMSVAGRSVFNRSFAPVLFDSFEQPAPDCGNCIFGSMEEHCNLECMESLDAWLQKHYMETAAMIIEPMIMGAGGMKFYKKEVLSLINKLCKSYGILLIYDEVFTGFGRTGEKFAYMHSIAPPDIMAVAKGLTGGNYPLAATLVSAKVFAEFNNDDPEKVFYHGHTMTGNPVGCAAALAALEIYEKEDMAGQISELSLLLEEGTREIAAEFPDQVRSVRTLGAVAVIELVSGKPGYLSEVGNIIKQTALGNGVILRPLGNQLYLVPPYNIQKSSINRIFAVIRICLENIALGD